VSSEITKVTGQPEKPEEQAAGKTGEGTVLKVILADSQAIYRVGVRKVIALEDDIRVVAQAETLGQALAAASKFNADVILFEAELSTNPGEALSELARRTPNSKIVVLADNLDEQRTVDFLRRGARGIVPRSVPPDLLVRCMRKVSEGETWLDNRGVNWVIEAYRAQAAQLTGHRPKSHLSDKEMLIISLVAQGLKNKEIAQEIGTTEQVIKNYLRKVYDKLGVFDRLELALYCIHHQLLNKAQVAAAGDGGAGRADSGAPQPFQPKP